MAFEPVGASPDLASAAKQRSAITFDRICDTAAVGLCMVDNLFRFVYLNQTFADMNGLPIAAHIGRTPSEVVPALGEQAEAAFRKILEIGEPQLGLEVVGATQADPGIPHVWKESWVPMVDDDGRIIGINISASTSRHGRIPRPLNNSYSVPRLIAMSEKQFK
jgi:PAS domain-containing protein